jgi:hypothetical protein
VIARARRLSSTGSPIGIGSALTGGLVLVTLDTGTIAWTVVAESEPAAVDALREAWRTHVAQCDPGTVWTPLMDELLAEGAHTVIAVTPGTVLRDGSPIARTTAPRNTPTAGAE